MYNVIVLMSTYNGEKYLEEQIQSIIKQSIDVKLIVRDDGSTDRTCDILQKYHMLGKLEWYKGENIGFMKSFLTLLKNAPEAYYYAFSDQDDYWENNKIKIAIEKIENKNIPCLYCSNLKIVDEHLKDLPYIYNKNKMDTKFENILWHNISAGCTMVFNDKLAKYINKYNPCKIKYHDWWVCLLAATFGKIIYDEEMYIKYRQHASNVIGCKTKCNLMWLKNKFIGKKIKWNDGRAYHQELLNGYGKELSENQMKILNDMLNFESNYKSRIRLILNKNFSVNNLKGDIYRRLLIMLGIN